MTLVAVGPVTKDLIITKENRLLKAGGAVYFQSFVFEEFFDDYLIITNCSDESLINDFANPDKVRMLKKDSTHYFINEYPDDDDFRLQYSNFAEVSITENDVENLLPDDIDAFILNPLNAFDFPEKTVDYIKSFDVPVYMSLQGFLRFPSEKIRKNAYSISLRLTSGIADLLSDAEGLFLDEAEAGILFENIPVKDLNIPEIIITNGSKGSRVIADKEYLIEAVECDEICDSTGCGDTYMATYICERLNGNSILKSANFASKIASDKLRYFGPFKSDI